MRPMGEVWSGSANPTDTDTRVGTKAVSRNDLRKRRQHAKATSHKLFYESVYLQRPRAGVNEESTGERPMARVVAATEEKATNTSRPG